MSCFVHTWPNPHVWLHALTTSWFGLHLSSIDQKVFTRDQTKHTGEKNVPDLKITKPKYRKCVKMIKGATRNALTEGQTLKQGFYQKHPNWTRIRLAGMKVHGKCVRDRRPPINHNIPDGGKQNVRGNISIFSTAVFGCFFIPPLV